MTTIERLKQKNLKITPQRLSILEMLSNTTEHPDAETIYKALKPHHPGLGLATVYKTLDAFREAELLQELNVGEGRFRYDANCDSHPHFICGVCERVLDVHGISGIDSLREQAADSLNAHIEQTQVFFYGTCTECVSDTQ